MILFLLLFPIGFGGAMIQSYFGRLIGLVMGASAIGGLIGPTMAGYLFDTTGRYSFTWILLGIAALSSVALMLGLEQQKKTN